MGKRRAGSTTLHLALPLAPPPHPASSQGYKSFGLCTCDLSPLAPAPRPSLEVMCITCAVLTEISRVPVTTPHVYLCSAHHAGLHLPVAGMSAGPDFTHSAEQVAKQLQEETLHCYCFYSYIVPLSLQAPPPKFPLCGPCHILSGDRQAGSLCVWSSVKPW